MKVFFIQTNTSNYNDKQNGNKEEKKQMLISNATKIISHFGWFQIRSFIFLSCPSFCASMLVAAFIFFNIVPPYQCQTRNKFAKATNVRTKSFGEQKYFAGSIGPYVVQAWLTYDNTSEYNGFHNFSSNYSFENNQCFRFSNESKQLRSNASLQKLISKNESCLNRLVFDTTNGNSVVSQFSLVCERAWMRPFTSGSLMIGMFVGTLLGVRLADRFGRRSTSLLAYLACTIFIITTSFSPSLIVYFPLSFLTGTCYILVYIPSYTWLIEIAGRPDKRVWASFAHSFAYSCGGASISLIAYLVEDWSKIYITCGVIYFVGFVFSCLVPESPSWLLQKNKLNQAAKVLKTITKTNKIEFDKFLENESQLNNEMPSPSAREELSIALLWKNKILRRRQFLFSLIWGIVTLSLYTNALNSANIGGNAHINNLIGSSLDLISTALTAGVLKKLKRRTALFSVALSSGCLLVATPLVKQGNEIAGICFAMLGRFFIYSFSTITYLYSGEVFPTILRSTSTCICVVASRLTATIVPFLIFAGEEVNLSIPFYVMGGISFASLYLISLLPETSTSLLPHTLDDALALKDPRYLPRFKSCSRESKQIDSTADNATSSVPV